VAIEYLVRWEIDIYADSREEAAREALRIQRKPDSIATVFDVVEKRGPGEVQPVVRVDLDA